MKTCNVCLRELPLDSFGKHARKRDGLRGYCKECDRSKQRDWYQGNASFSNDRGKRWRLANKEKVKEIRRRCNLKSQYGISVEQYDAMLVQQSGRCLICKTDEWGGRHNRPAIDHDHETGVVRGLLCNACNIGLGVFRDSPDLLRSAAGYLEVNGDIGKRRAA